MKTVQLQKVLLVLVVLILAAGLVTVGSALAARSGGTEQGGRPLYTALNGSQEVPGPGDPDGSGTALITLNQGQGQVCWELTAVGIATPTAAHIHEGAQGVAGPVVVTLSPPVGGSSSGCASVDAALIQSIRQNPAMFYVNIHNADYPSGALRGQLYKTEQEPYPYPIPYP
jgi:hypothetical protein